jgi:Fe-S cluster assembly protein SufD
MMQAVAEPTAPPATSYGEGFAAFRESLAGEPAFIYALRELGMERFNAVGFPTIRQEEWRATNVAAIARAAFPPASEPGKVEAATVEKLSFEGTDRLVFVDGFFAPEFSRVGALPPGATLGSLEDGWGARPDVMETHLGQHASIERHPFAALNGAYFRTGAFLHLAPGTVLERPVHLLFLATQGEVANFPRNLIVAEANTEATVIENYVGLGEIPYFTAPVTEVALGDNAHVDHYKVQSESLEAFHVAVQQSHHGRDTQLRSHSITLGGALVRNDLGGVLNDEGSDLTLNGLYLAAGKQHIDNHMRVDHAKPHCTSHELYKGILEGHARTVFNGLIYVHPDAQKTDAKQSNQNLLLSPDAIANSNPQLEIFADDVRCTHGSTVGQLDDEAVFYLRSRGIGQEAARSLLTWAFASELVAGIRVDAVRKELEEFLFHRLPKGEVVRQAI